VEFPDFEEFIASLNAHRVRYLVVGAYAVGFHARPRATKDIDVLVDRTPANARRVLSCLQSFLGCISPNVTEAKLENPRTLIVLGVSPVRIDADEHRWCPFLRGRMEAARGRALRDRAGALPLPR
jgi:hypothetical protein